MQGVKDEAPKISLPHPCDLGNETNKGDQYTLSYNCTGCRDGWFDTLLLVLAAMESVWRHLYLQNSIWTIPNLFTAEKPPC